MGSGIPLLFFPSSVVCRPRRARAAAMTSDVCAVAAVVAGVRGKTSLGCSGSVTMHTHVYQQVYRAPEGDGPVPAEVNSNGHCENVRVLLQRAMRR